MKWDIRIENKSNQRIVVKFDPIDKQLSFVGQYKLHNREWVDFTITKQSLWFSLTEDDKYNRAILAEKLITLETIQKQLLKTYEELKKLVEIYENIAEGMSVIKMIEIVEDLESKSE
jgi:hypothetical protein